MNHILVDCMLFSFYSTTLNNVHIPEILVRLKHQLIGFFDFVELLHRNRALVGVVRGLAGWHRVCCGMLDADVNVVLQLDDSLE